MTGRNKELRPPRRRSWLRLRMGKLYYTLYGAIASGSLPAFTGPGGGRQRDCRRCSSAMPRR